MKAKKVEMQKFVERGVCKMVDLSEVKPNPESVMFWLNWSSRTRGSVECPNRRHLIARQFVSDTIDRDILFSGTPRLPIARSSGSTSCTVLLRLTRSCFWPSICEDSRITSNDIEMTAFLYTALSRILARRVALPVGDILV